jgi:predicted RecB family endonuclease
MNDKHTSVRSLLEKGGRQSAAVKEVGVPEIEADYSAYAHGRISRHTQSMVIFRRADGSANAFAYAYVMSVAGEDTTSEFRIDFSQHKVVVKGRNLETLFQLVCQHRVAEIREAERNQNLTATPDAAVVESIQIDDAAGTDNRRNRS